MTACRLSHPLLGFAVLALLSRPASAQYGAATPDVQPNNYPPALPQRRTPGPQLVFERIGEIGLPGPLAQHPGWVADGQVVIPVESGTVHVAPEADATPALGPDAAVPAPVEWVIASDGKHRYRTTPEGIVEAERRTHSGKKWKRTWRIVAPNSILAPPILVGPRLCYAGLDDRVTCVRASNGHRLWAVDLGDRLSHGLTCWPRCGDPAREAEILLAVPDDGATVIALDAYDGRKVAAYELPAHHHFASAALVVPGDRIAITRKGYDDREAALVLLRLTPPPPGHPPAAVPYNGASPARTGPAGR